MKKDSDCDNPMNKTSDLPEILKDDDLNSDSKPYIQLRPQEVSLKLVPNEDMKVDIDVMVCKPDIWGEYYLECFQMKMHGVKSISNSYKMLAQTIKWILTQFLLQNIFD